ncbi:zinc finger CCCH domain-containing protein 41-like [Diospyros lotus]|uniref:zinc finger CCCH domain-containing protein 41-like n=1 Tax=Diospyros lotus TaxID=55363 RepID=UPI00224CBCA1|nr:zinc finger CCCH domain-containing protein 41-like [Diospyros lotus]
MDLKVSSLNTMGLSSSYCVSDPEKEISDDDDDDRNHKHRRREIQSHSLERETPEQVLIRPYRKRNRPFEYGHSYRENDSWSSETGKGYNMTPLVKDPSVKFERRHLGLSTFPRPPIRFNQFAEVGLGRGRGRESGSWNQRDQRFSSVDISSQFVPHGSVASSLFAGRGLQYVSNSQSTSWGAFGLIPGIPNGGVDTIHPLGLQGTLGPSITPPLNIGFPRQQCRDFEERGFCLRGDMCPMEHGVNWIVVEDVQSLSQFNLPVSLPSAHVLGGPSALPSVAASSSTLINSKRLNSKSRKTGMGETAVFTDSLGASGTDFYDPDQPLWTNDCPETSNGLRRLNGSKPDETETFLDADSADHHHVRLFDGSDTECLVRTTETAVGSKITTSSMGGRIGTNNKSEVKEKIDSAIMSSNFSEKEANKDQEAPANLHGAALQGKQVVTEDVGPKAVDLSLKTRGETGSNTRKPSQKALRTLFINGIPQKENKREALLSHFQKFGDVIDIYIPLNSERAFVQFSKREEAEAALKAPDAIMGNRFIKLWWANRDTIPDDGMGTVNSLSVTGHGLSTVSVPNRFSVAYRGKDNLQIVASKNSVPSTSVAVVPVSDYRKPVATNSLEAPPPSQKKLESLEILKEELRKKQELLDQKRSDFQRQLHKFEKQTSSVKGEVPSEQAAKRQQLEAVVDVAKPARPRSADSCPVITSSLAEVNQMIAEKNKSLGNVMQQSFKQSMIATFREPSILKYSVRPLAPAGAPFVMNRFKLDNRPMAFKIVPPLPDGLANVAALKEHFSAYGELLAVELEDVEPSNAEASKNCSAQLSFTTRRSAEKAFTNGRSWQGHHLQFIWMASNNSRNVNGVRDNPPSASMVPSDSNLKPAEITPADLYVAVSGIGESENLERKQSGEEHMEQDEGMQSDSPEISCKKQSPKGDGC